MSVLQEFFQASLVIMIMLVASDLALVTFAPDMVGMKTTSISTLDTNISTTGAGTVSQATDPFRFPTMETDALAMTIGQLGNDSNTKKVLGWIFEQIIPDQTNDAADAIFSGLLSPLLGIFFFFGLIYLPLAVILAFFGSGIP